MRRGELNNFGSEIPNYVAIALWWLSPYDTIFSFATLERVELVFATT